MKTAKILVALASVALAGTVGFVFTGIYNIGADAPHWTPARKMIDVFRERSINARASSIKTPALDDPAMIAEGAEHYGAMCVQCHLAPGMKNSELREGLYPLPPNLAEHRHGDQDHGDSAARQFWIIKHGIKMTSMPAAGKTHDDAEIWGIVAFIRKLPDMTPEEFSRLTTDNGGHEHGDAKGGEHAEPDKNDPSNAPGSAPHHHDSPGTDESSPPAPESLHEHDPPH
jgi:mono/diheme cytochrome c family protein